MRLKPFPTIELFGLFFTLSFIVFNFIDRDLSNISMICLLLISIYSILFHKINLKINNEEKLLVYSFISFSLMIFLSSIYHLSSLDKLDNYSRFILLLPIYFYLRTIRINPSHIIYTIIISSLFSLISVLMIFNETTGNMSIPGRFNPVSSTAITFGNLNMTIFILLIVGWIYKHDFKINSYLIIVGLAASFLCWTLTYTKGSLIGFIFAMLYLNIYSKSLRLLSVMVVILSVIIISFSNLNQRFIILIEDVNNIINGESILSQEIDASLRERAFYFSNAIQIMKDKPLTGIGFNAFEEYLIKKTKSNNLNISTSDHAHNEFLDIGLKTGIIGLIVFIAFFINLYRFFSKTNLNYKDFNYFKCCGKIIILSQIGYMMTQSQFAHHQPTVFFIILTLMFGSQMISRVKKAT